MPLREAVTRLLHKEPEQRPTAQVLTMIKFFRDPFVHALQFLDVSKMKDIHQKEHFYTTTLKELLPYMPKVRVNLVHNSANSSTGLDFHILRGKMINLIEIIVIYRHLTTILNSFIVVHLLQTQFCN